jgi:tripartite-type tricarboxylate transporter receptor subunit TctC
MQTTGSMDGAPDLPQMRTWACGLFVLLVGCLAAHAQAPYPNRPIRIVVPYTPGGTVDVLARAISPALHQALGQPIIVENRSGAGGNIGAEFVAKSAPDGYTLLMSTNAPLTINVALNPVKYDPIRDFNPIIMTSTATGLLSVNPRLQVRSTMDLVALAKAKPSELSIATSGIGTASHLSLLQFNRLANVQTTTVPFRGGPESMTAAVAGDVNAVFSDLVPALPLIREGRLRALAITAPKRSILAPDLPTLDEAGLTGFDGAGWTAAFAPANTPRDIVDRLNREINVALSNPELRQKLITIGIEPAGGSSEEIQALLRREVPRWKAIVEQAGLATK